MVAGKDWSGLLIQALAVASSVQAQAGGGGGTPSAEVLTSHAQEAILTLHDKWYDVNTGLWARAWWNSGNVLTMLADFGGVATEAANEINVGGYMRHTYTRAQMANVRTRKERGLAARRSDAGPQTTDEMAAAGAGGVDDHTLQRRGFPNFINEFYDDEGWWALALLRSYDVTRDESYLDSAVTIFKDMKTGLGGPCDGGIFWNKDRAYVPAIANELYLSVAAGLANRVGDGDGRSNYLKIARDQWAWFDASGMINAGGLINDGLTDACDNNGLQTWSYNQGVVLGGLVELARAERDSGRGGRSAALIRRAAGLAEKSMAHLTRGDGRIVLETDGCERNEGQCGRDGQQFKGAYIRNLRYLWEAMPAGDARDEIKAFIVRQAVSIWNRNRSEDGAMLGANWAGPYKQATGMTQSAALDAIVAAIAVSK